MENFNPIKANLMHWNSIHGLTRLCTFIFKCNLHGNHEIKRLQLKE